MKLEVYTPDKQLYSGQAECVSCLGHDGWFQILDHHTACVAVLMEGTLSIKVPEQEEILKIPTQRGIVEVLNNEVKILTE